VSTEMGDSVLSESNGPKGRTTLFGLEFQLSQTTNRKQGGQFQHGRTTAVMVMMAQVLDPSLIKRLGSSTCGTNIGVAQELGPGLK
jgi:hypothetical protein